MNIYAIHGYNITLNMMFRTKARAGKHQENQGNRRDKLDQLVLIQVKIRPEHCLMPQGGRLDDGVDMHEQQGEATCEIHEVPLGHWVKLPTKTLGQVLVMVLLQNLLNFRCRKIITICLLCSATL